MRLALCTLFLWGTLVGPGAIAAEPAANEIDSAGILIRPIPDKLVALTFDDGPASHATVVAPILKALGFGGSFYVCDFDSFHTRKDWYLTYRQMKAMSDDGFEIGNHTVGHGGGLENYLRMEDQLLANHVPKPTTMCWPVYHALPGIYQDLAAHGYTFGRGGHERPYRPTVDSPFDVPSFTIRDGISVETFARQAELARHGMVVVFCFHGVPDMEHPPVGLEPATFKLMMQYLKDNDYQCIALRDLAKYIDPAKAAKLPTTARDVKALPGLAPVPDDKRPISAHANDILEFAFPGLSPGKISQTAIRVTVPYTTNLAALAPKIRISAGATVAPESGQSGDFTHPQTYVVTAQNGATKTYTLTVSKTAASTEKEVLAFSLPGAKSVRRSGTRVAAYLPASAEVSSLAPSLKLSPFATAVPASGTARDFTTPQDYTITAQDGSSQVWTVTVVRSDKPSDFTWKEAKPGNWSDPSKWTTHLDTEAAPIAAGPSDTVVNFNLDGVYAVNQDLQEGMKLNQLNFLQTRGLKLAGKSLSLVTDGATGFPPQINVLTPSESDHISLPLELAADVTVNVKPRGRLTVEGLLSGKGGLTLHCPGATDEDYSSWGILRINNKINTFSGGVVIHGGQLFLFDAHQGLGTGLVTLNKGGDIRLDNIQGITNPLIINGGTVEGGASWNGPITLNGNARFAGHLKLNEAGGGINGPGGLTQIGPIGAFSRVNIGWVVLAGVNTYEGPTTVRMGTLIVKKGVSLYNANVAKWTAKNITVHPAAKLKLMAGGPGEFSGSQLGELLTNLTANVQQNGLLAGALFDIESTSLQEMVTISANIADSQGPGGGAFAIHKSGPGVLCLAGQNTFSGPIILKQGGLQVASLNRVAGGNKHSSLGAPKNIDAGEIVFGQDDAECALIYTGTGETSDRVMNLAGKNTKVTFDQSGSGLLKLEGDFLISGYGSNKTIVLSGSNKGTGEIASPLSDPYDRAGKATTSLLKTGSGTWTLSGVNRHTGPTTVAQGVLTLANERALGDKTDIRLATGAQLKLNFAGRLSVRSLTIEEQRQTPGEYDAARLPNHIQGTGTLVVLP